MLLNECVPGQLSTWLCISLDKVGVNFLLFSLDPNLAVAIEYFVERDLLFQELSTAPGLLKESQHHCHSKGPWAIVTHLSSGTQLDCS